MNTNQLRAQISRLLRNHPHVGARTGPLVEVVQQCEFADLPPGHVLCREGDPGRELFFVMSGSLKVTRRDRSGVVRDLATIRAPALLGHMSVIDRSPRSATCTIVDRAHVGTLSQAVCDRHLHGTDPSSTAFRRLLLTSLQQQMRSGISRLRSLMSTEQDDRAAEQALQETTAVLGGWSPDSDDDASWKRDAFELAQALPLEAGARLVVDMDGAVPFSLELDRFSQAEANRVITRFIRFLATIPRPPAVRVRFRDCPAWLLPRPQLLNQRMRLFFPLNTFTVDGSDEDVQITFTSPDRRWAPAAAGA